jgi:hypothetical protein
LKGHKEEYKKLQETKSIERVEVTDSKFSFVSQKKESQNQAKKVAKELKKSAAPKIPSLEGLLKDVDKLGPK